MTSGISQLDSQNLYLGHYDVCVVGGGPAGVAAAIYSVRKGLKTALVVDSLGGQMTQTAGIENFISIPLIQGVALAENFKKHVLEYPVHLFEYQRVSGVRSKDRREMFLESGEMLSSDALIITTGARVKELGVPGEREFLGRGVAYCPHCDGPFYKGLRVAVVGGGNSGVEAAIDLAGTSREVVLLHRGPALKADEVLVRRLKTLENVKVLLDAKTTEIFGGKGGVTGIRYRKNDGEATEYLDGVFVQIGLTPNSSPFKGLLEMNQFGEIIIDERCRTSVPGIYAAGDVTTAPYKQIVIATGEGAKAALSAFEERLRR